MSVGGPDELAPGDEVAPDTESGGANVCPDCGGTGRVCGEPCESCAGTGYIEEAVGGG